MYMLCGSLWVLEYFVESDRSSESIKWLDLKVLTWLPGWILQNRSNMNNVHCGKFLFSLKPILVVSMEWLAICWWDCPLRLFNAFQNTDSEPSSCYFSIYSWYLSVFEAKSIDGGCHMNPSWRFDIATITGGYFQDISHIFPYFPYEGWGFP